MQIVVRQPLPPSALFRAVSEVRRIVRECTGSVAACQLCASPSLAVKDDGGAVMCRVEFTPWNEAEMEPEKVQAALMGQGVVFAPHWGLASHSTQSRALSCHVVSWGVLPSNQDLSESAHGMSFDAGDIASLEGGGPGSDSPSHTTADTSWEAVLSLAADIAGDSLSPSTAADAPVRTILLSVSCDGIRGWAYNVKPEVVDQLLQSLWEFAWLIRRRSYVMRAIVMHKVGLGHTVPASCVALKVERANRGGSGSGGGAGAAGPGGAALSSDGRGVVPTPHDRFRTVSMRRGPGPPSMLPSVPSSRGFRGAGPPPPAVLPSFNKPATSDAPQEFRVESLDALDFVFKSRSTARGVQRSAVPLSAFDTPMLSAPSPTRHAARAALSTRMVNISSSDAASPRPGGAGAKASLTPKDVWERVLAADAAGLTVAPVSDIAKRTGDVRFGDPVRLHVLQVKGADRSLAELRPKVLQPGSLAVARTLKEPALEGLFSAAPLSDAVVTELGRRKATLDVVASVIGTARPLSASRFAFSQVRWLCDHARVCACAALFAAPPPAQILEHPQRPTVLDAFTLALTKHLTADAGCVVIAAANPDVAGADGDMPASTRTSRSATRESTAELTISTGTVVTSPLATRLRVCVCGCRGP